jgi:periplasmic divalent cation tolerance protein
MNNLILVYITNPNKKEAIKIARYLLKKRLIACANVFPVESFYWWKGKIQNEKEFVLIGKALAKNFVKIKKEVKKVHSYLIPCVLKIPVRANKEFFNWVKTETK